MRRLRAPIHRINDSLNAVKLLFIRRCNWLVNKAKIEPKTVRGILRHARIQTTLDLYTGRARGIPHGS
jgi:hypothetical protein